MTQPFSESFKQKIRERDQYRCLICGRESKEVAHVKSHRAMGGKLFYYEDGEAYDINSGGNCAVLCRRHHAQLDRRRKPWLKIDGFDPDNELLEVSVYEYGEWQPLDSRYLHYYRR